MCKERKYVSYKVVVNKKGGVKEEIQFEGINGSSYKNMLDAYRHYISECLTNDIITIDFCGVSSEGKLGIMWTKECKKETDKTPFEVIADTIDEIKSYKDNYKNISVIDITTEKFNKQLVVAPAYGVKGVEFDSVIIINNFSNDKYLYYVAVTRAQHELIVYE